MISIEVIRRALILEIEALSKDLYDTDKDVEETLEKISKTRDELKGIIDLDEDVLHALSSWH